MDRLSELRERTPEMVEHLRAFVEAESFSNDRDAVAVCAGAVADTGARLLGVDPERVVVDGRTHLLWRIGARSRVLLIGHMDTVWPIGTAARWPFRIDGDRASGPGAFDMKSGIVQGLHALATLPDRAGVTVLITSDEEIGSPTSTAIIRDLAAESRATLVLEPAAGGALKTARKGVSMYSIAIAGRAAHAGLEPQNGASALIELAHQVFALGELQDLAAGTTVTPTVAHAGSAMNVVPASATLDVDVRVQTTAEQDRIHRAITNLATHVAGTSLTVSGEPNRPPLEKTMSAALFERARAIAADIGIGALTETSVGGASDGNFTAAIGCPTLDGLGGVGDGAHAEGEYVVVSEMAPRAALVAALVEDLLKDGAP